MRRCRRTRASAPSARGRCLSTMTRRWSSSYVNASRNSGDERRASATSARIGRMRPLSSSIAFLSQFARSAEDLRLVFLAARSRRRGAAARSRQFGSKLKGASPMGFDLRHGTEPIVRVERGDDGQAKLCEVAGEHPAIAAPARFAMRELIWRPPGIFRPWPNSRWP